MRPKKITEAEEKTIIRLFLEGNNKKVISQMTGQAELTVALVIKSNDIDGSMSKIPVYKEAVMLYLNGRTAREIRMATGLPPHFHKYIARKYAAEKKRRMDASRGNKVSRPHCTWEDRRRMLADVRSALTGYQAQDRADEQVG